MSEVTELGKVRNILPFPKVTRVEVIDHGGRSYINTVAGDVEIQLQDDGRTLKVFTSGSGH